VVEFKHGFAMPHRPFSFGEQASPSFPLLKEREAELLFNIQLHD
jgi:hypothetical protein